MENKVVINFVQAPRETARTESDRQGVEQSGLQAQS